MRPGLTKAAISSHNKGLAAASSSRTTPTGGANAREHKQRKTTVLKCIRCRRTSDTIDWANKKAGAPTGNVCQRCQNIFTDGNFEIYGTMDELLKKMDDDAELKRDFEKAEAAYDATTPTSFCREHVQSTDGFEIYMERSYLGLSRAQFKTAAGKVPEDCGLKLLDLPAVGAESGEKGLRSFKGLLVTDPSMPYTRYILRRRLAIDKKKVLMSAEKHLYPRQALLLHNHEAMHGIPNPNMVHQTRGGRGLIFWVWVWRTR